MGVGKIEGQGLFLVVSTTAIMVYCCSPPTTTTIIIIIIFYSQLNRTQWTAPLWPTILLLTQLGRDDDAGGLMVVVVLEVEVEPVPIHPPPLVAIIMPALSLSLSSCFGDKQASRMCGIRM